MAILLASKLPARILQVLQDYLSAELALVDLELADGITTPAVPQMNMHEWDRQLVPDYPAVTLQARESDPQEVRPAFMGSRVHALHRFTVRAHVTLADAGQDALTLQKMCFRYVQGIVRVLLIKYDGLQTAADPNRYVSGVFKDGPWGYGPEASQEGGVVVRTASVPLAVRRIEP